MFGIMLVVFAIKGTLLGPDQKEECATSVLWDFRERGNINSITISELWCPEEDLNLHDLAITST